MVAFSSEDGKFVLKIFKGWHTRPKKISHFFRDSREKKITSTLNWKRKFEETCLCYQMAFSELQDETGLIYLHFKKTDSPPLKTRLIDYHLNSYTFDLNELPFLLQKKAILVPEYLSSLLKNQEIEKAKQAILSLEKLFESRTKKGFTDQRQSLRINYGFIEGKAIQFDVGKLIYDSSLKEDPFLEIQRLKRRLYSWVSDYFPQLITASFTPGQSREMSISNSNTLYR